MKKQTTKMLILMVLIGLFIVITSSSVCAASTVYVNVTGGNDSNNGTIDHPYQTIGKGINSVDENGTVKIADGTYSGENNTDLTILKSMNITGQSQTGTIINGTGTSWIFNIEPGISVTLSNLTLANGYTSGDGGAIYNKGNLTIENCNIRNNTANYGGGIYNSGTLNIKDSTTINNNTAIISGGGIYNGGTIAVINSTIIGNMATSNAGGILNGGDCTVIDSTIIGNTATKNGGIYNDEDSVMTMIGSTIKGNTATNGNGGGIYNDGILTVKNSSIIMGNTATNGNGGGIYNGYDTLNVIDSIIIGNTATGDGGGIYFRYGTLNVTGCNFESNQATSYGNAIYNIVGDTTTRIVQFNRFYDMFSGYEIYAYSGSVDAQYNWWGSNIPAFSTLIYGNVDYTPWLYLTFTADPLSVPQGSTSSLTARFNQGTDGTNITQLDPANGHIPDGSPVTFTTTLGNVGSKSVVKYTHNGTATATLRADESAGEAKLSVLVEGQPLTFTVTITPVSAATTTSVNATTTTSGNTVRMQNTGMPIAATTTSVNATTTTSGNTVGMQNTGMPIAGLVLAVLAVLGGTLAPRKK